MSDKIHTIVTEKIIAALEAGTVPWAKPWKAESGRPRKMSNNDYYKGINVWLLALTAAEKGYESPWWGTYDRIAELSGMTCQVVKGRKVWTSPDGSPRGVRKGEKSTLVVWWNILVKDEVDPATGKTTTKRIPMLRYSIVFNAEQADGLPERYHPAQDERIVPDPIAAAETVFASYIDNGGPALQYVRADRACYNRVDDVMTLPERDQFPTIESFYSTAFHECAHSTGHKDRLNRDDLNDSTGILHANDAYSREELVAEMTSVIVMAETGVDTDHEFAQSAGYIAGWLKALKSDDNKRLIVTAASRADKAAEMILGASVAVEVDDEETVTLAA